MLGIIIGFVSLKKKKKYCEVKDVTSLCFSNQLQKKQLTVLKLM